MARKIIFSILLLISIRGVVLAQNLQSIYRFNFNLSQLGYNFEQKVGANVVLNYHVRNSLLWRVTTRLESNASFEFVDYVNLEIGPKWYYNFKNRGRSNKKIRLNSANFLELYVGYRTKNLIENNYVSQYSNCLYLAPHWGMQRVFGKESRWGWYFTAGIVSFYNRDEKQLNTNLDLGVGLHYSIPVK